MFAALLLAALSGSVSGAARPPAISTVVVVLLDDVGFDLLAHTPTPNLDRVRDLSARFSAWSNPLCSPTRACLLSAQYGFRTGVVRNVRVNGVPDGLSGLTPTIADWVAAKSSWVGKWHLSGDPDNLSHPADVGFTLHSGVMNNLGVGGTTYFDWDENVNGTIGPQTTYATSKVTSDAVRAVGVSRCRLVVMAAYAAHKPRHVPPAELHGQGDPSGNFDRSVAMLEAFDTDFARVLAALGPEDFLVVTSDNGTESDIADDPRSKGTVYQGGVSVPMWISGPDIAPGDRAGLVDMVDVGPTVLDLLGLGLAPSSGVDGVSFAASCTNPSIPTGRQFSYAERSTFTGDRHRAIRDDTYKLIRIDGLQDEFYSLAVDPQELFPLPASGPDWQTLSDALTALSGT